jgi:hypothetical protein
MVAALLLAMASASGVMDGGSGIEPKMHNAHLPPIATLTIQSSGATAPASGAASSEPTEQCAAFKLSYPEIRKYISKAAQVTEHDYFHMLDWSPCYTNGKVTFKNGVTGIWSIQQYRSGSLKLSNGRTVYLYCPQCQAKAFPAAEK